MNIILLSPNSLKIQNSLCHSISITFMCSLQSAILGGIHFISPTACFLSPTPTHMYTHTHTLRKKDALQIWPRVPSKSNTSAL